MPKLKTHKGTRKRFKITAKKKIFHRQGGQDHFNSRESGQVTKAKRRDRELSRPNQNAVKKLMPYL